MQVAMSAFSSGVCLETWYFHPDGLRPLASQDTVRAGLPGTQCVAIVGSGGARGSVVVNVLPCPSPGLWAFTWPP